MVDFGRLKSPLPHSEITLSMIRSIKQEYNKFLQQNQDLAQGDYGKFLKDFQDNFDLIGKLSQDLGVLEVRMEGSLNSIESKLVGYRKNFKNHPNAKEMLGKINSFLEVIAKIRNAMRNETKRTIIDQRKILRHV